MVQIEELAAESDQDSTGFSDSEEEMERRCRICYESGDSSELGGFLSPCKCSGTIKWVHKKCLITWFDKASGTQYHQCTMCRYVYRRSFKLKPLSDWCFPKIFFNPLQCLEIVFDIYSSLSLYRHFMSLISAQKWPNSRSIFLLFMWRYLVFPQHRVQYYKKLGFGLLESMFKYSILNCPG